MGKLILYVVTFFWGAFLFLSYSPSAHAAFLFLDPTSKTLTGKEKVEVKIKINTEGEKPTTTDAIVIYDNTKLKIIEVKEPLQSEKFFPRFFLNNRTNKVFIGSAIQPQGTPESGEGLIATLIFEGVADGTTKVSIQCETGKTTDSNITLKKNQRVTDIIDCTKSQDATFTIGGIGGGANPTPTTGALTPTVRLLSGTPTPSKTATPTATIAISPTPTLFLTPTFTPTPTMIATPSALPETGDIKPTTIAISIGLGLTLISIIIKLLL